MFPSTKKGKVFIFLAIFILWKKLKLYWNRYNKITILKKPLGKVGCLVEQCPSLKTYIPPLWCVGGVLQSICGNMAKPSKNEIPRKQRETIMLKEMEKRNVSVCCPPIVPQGAVSIDWVHPDKDDETSSIVLAVPGLTGDSNEAYIMMLATGLAKKGIRVACYNPRGRGGNEVKTPFLYSVGYTEDLRRVIQHIRKSYAKSKSIFGVGFSLGANYLAKYAGEEGENCLLAGIVLLGCPIDCLVMSHHLNTSIIGKLMDPVLVKSVQTVRKEYEEVLKEHPGIDMQKLAAAKTMAEFDHYAIAPMFDFRCVSDYYRHSSSGNVLSNISQPALFIHALNDPIVPGALIRMDNFTTNPNLIHCMTNQGGHSMSWPYGVRCEKSWTCTVVKEFVEAVENKKKYETEKVWNRKNKFR